MIYFRVVVSEAKLSLASGLQVTTKKEVYLIGTQKRMSALEANTSLPPLPKAVRASHGFIPAPSAVHSCMVSVCLQKQAHFRFLCETVFFGFGIEVSQSSSDA